MRYLEVLIKVPVPEQLQLQRRTDGASKRVWVALIAVLLIAYMHRLQQESKEVIAGQVKGSQAKQESPVTVIVSEPDPQVKVPPEGSALAQATVPLSAPPLQSRTPVEKGKTRSTPSVIANKSQPPPSRVVAGARGTENAMRPVTSEFLAGKLIRKVLPVYPVLAIRNRISGTVILRAIISEQGKIRELRVESGPSLLIDAATDAVRKWEYQPWILGGKPVEMENTIEVIFKLRPSK